MSSTNPLLAHGDVARTRPLARWNHAPTWLAAVFCLVAACFALAGCSEVTSEPDEAVVDQAPVEVQVAVVERTTLHPALNLVGIVVAIPEQTAVVSPQLGGWITSVPVVEGQRVKAHDVIVTLDPRASELAVQRAAAVVMEKQATLERLQRGYLPQEIAAARQNARQAEAAVAALRNELTALRDLLKRGEVSEVAYQNKTKALEGAMAAAAAAAERVKLLEAGTRPEMIAEARGLLEAAQADLARAQLELSWCTIASPIDGTITLLTARRGQFFNAAQPLATVIDLSSVFLQLQIPGEQSARVQVGTAVEVRPMSQPRQVIQGSVVRIRSEADPQTGNLVVFAKVKNADGMLRPGQSCQARVALPEITGALAVPIAAVADNGGQSVVTVIRSNRAYETPVETGVETDGLAQILQGLSAGDQVAVAGGYGLPPGCPVKITASHGIAK